MTDVAVAPPVSGFRSLAWPLAGVAVVIAGLVYLAILADARQQRERESARLEAMSDLRAGQVASWLRDKLAQARFAGNSPLGELYLRWRESGDATARDRLMDRLSSFLKASGAHTVLVLDDQARPMVSEPLTDQPVTPELQAAVRRAIETGSPQFTQLYGTDGALPAPRLDVVAPLTLSGQPARGVVVVRLDPNDYLFPLLGHWPLPSRTASTSLVRREGQHLIGPRGRTPIPLDSPDVLAAIVLRGQAPFGTALEAKDFRGQPSLGVVRPVPGTDWFLVARMDRDEVYADARRHALWLGLGGLATLLALGSAAYGWRERQALRQAQAGAAWRESERQRLEHVVQQRTAELAARNQSLARTVSDLEAFSASVSHDLRGPLHTISGFATMLDRSEADRLTDAGRQKLKRVIQGVNTMDRMIGDILRCSRAERVELHFREVDLEAVVDEVLRDLGPAYPASRIVRAPLPKAWADPTLAGQIFYNLIGNALKFSARQPAPQVEIGVEPGPGGAVLFVRDNGVGFEPVKSGKLFNAFQRLHSEHEFPGTGVGLSIVKRLLERHGGGIEAESQPGVRTVFRFRFGERPPAAA
jgi:signal transduction histidine kinase